MELAECKYLNSCDAPLCPLDKDTKEGVWYPDEPICRIRDAAEEFPWIKHQRRLQTKKTGAEGFFTIERLSTGAKKGIDSDTEL